MNLDPYASCPCGSGKKFKWCCQAIYPVISHAWELLENNQHESALQVMRKLTEEHPQNPEAWGQLASILWMQEKHDEAEQALDRAFAINPNFPFGLLLRTKFRLAEQEYKGALLLARKAVDAYDPESREPLAELNALIFQCEMESNRPLAARAALERALHLSPAQEQLREGMENIFGKKSRLPLVARKAYELQKPAGTTSEARRKAWDRVFAGAREKLSDLERGFHQLTQEDPKDTAAWYNLGLSRAWLGDNPGALEAFSHYVEQEGNEDRAAEAASLMEVLRLDVDGFEHSDYQNHLLVMPIQRIEPMETLLKDWISSKRLLLLQSGEKGVIPGLMIEESPTGLITVGQPSKALARIAGHLLIAGNLLHFSSTVRDRFERVRDEIRQRLQLGLTDLHTSMGPAPYHDIFMECAAVAMQDTGKEDMEQKLLEVVRHYFEDVWVHQPRKSLNNIPPIDAAGHGVLRKKLLGVIRFLEDIAQTTGQLGSYTFDSLRRKLGLAHGEVAAPSAAMAIESMGAAELSALKAGELALEQVEKAYQAAYRLDAHELAEKFAIELVSRPHDQGQADRYPWFAFLIQKAIRDGQWEAALKLLGDGEAFDREHRQSQRARDYSLFRAQVATKKGDVSGAMEAYQKLIQDNPRDLKIRGKAAEAMLGMKQPARALEMAEEGIKAARQANDRDSEQYLLELASAARRQSGG